MKRAGGREVCFLAEVTPDRRIRNPRPVARGNHSAVLAAAADAHQGEILLHNHPSGVLDPSPADLALAARVYEAGLGTGIVDNEARSLYVLVEPPAPRNRADLDPALLEAYLAPGGALEALSPSYEHRPAQLAMLRGVADRYNDGGLTIVEAGTGTGKSLAYLLPAVEWALTNGERSVVSTNTINLQEQLVGKDLPLVQELLGKEFRWSLVKGRGNYVSIRRLLLAAQTAPTLFESDRGAEMDGLVEWSRKTGDGSLSDLTTPPTEEIWDEVRSDGDICMGARCPHFQECFYQQSRRDANSADVLVVNHALLFADVALRRTTDNWSQSAVLPIYRHLVLDEAHNVEEAATLHLGAEVTRIGLFRALDRLDRNGKGVLGAVEEALRSSLDGTVSERLVERIGHRVRPALDRSREASILFFDAIEPSVPTEEEEPLRLGRGDPRDPSQDAELLERLDALRSSFVRLRGQIEQLRTRIEDDVSLADRLEGRLLDLHSIERRLQAFERGLGLILDPDRDREKWVRWIEGRGPSPRGLRNVILAAAPVEPGPMLRESLFNKVDTTVVTSATLATGGGFRFMRGRLGLESSQPPDPGPELASPRWEAAASLPGELAFADIDVSVLDESPDKPIAVEEMLLPSPFDYQRQALFCVPTDLPSHDSGVSYQEATAGVVAALAEITNGGLFVLFTSYRALRIVAELLREREARWPLLVHGEAPRSRLLQTFIEAGNGVLLGTTSFWEGVDVPGYPLRGLILQKIPFRVPTEPITQARMEAIEARGEKPFDTYQVPLAALRLKQGFGRLIRSRKDRGGILLLDSRILTRSYGRVLRSTLPPAPLVKGPWAGVLRRLRHFYDGAPNREGPVA